LTVNMIDGTQIPFEVPLHLKVRELKERVAHRLGDPPLEDLLLVHGVDVLQDKAFIGGSCVQDRDQLVLVQVNNSCRIGNWVPGRYLRECTANLPPPLPLPVSPPTPQHWPTPTFLEPRDGLRREQEEEEEEEEEENAAVVENSTALSSWIPFGDHPSKLERYRED